MPRPPLPLAALVLALPAALALTPQSTSANPVQEPAQLLLRCKIVRTKSFKPVSPKGVPDEPQIGQDAPDRLWASPIIMTLADNAAGIGLDGNGASVYVTALPKAMENGRYELTLSTARSFEKEDKPFHPVAYTLKANEWVRYPLLDAKGKFTGFQMILRLEPYSPEAAPKPSQP